MQSDDLPIPRLTGILSKPREGGWLQLPLPFVVEACSHPHDLPSIGFKTEDDALAASSTKYSEKSEKV